MRRWLATVAALAATAFLIFFWWQHRTERVERTGVLMDTPVRVVVYASPGKAEAMADAAIDEVSRLENLWHPDRPTSDVAQVNAAAGSRAVTVAPETLQLASLAREVAEDSGGAFDPTIGPLVRAWGFGGEHRVPSVAEREQARALVDWRALQIDTQAGTLYLAHPGMRIDLGAIAKGYASRLVRELLQRQGAKAGLVQLGGSVAMLGDRPEGGKWQIAVQHPRQADQYLTVLSLGSGFVDTAGDYQRYFIQDGVRYHHILDPATGAPARGMASVTVLAQQGEWADAFATAAFVLGMDRGYQFLLDHGVEAILVSDSGQVKVTPGLAKDVKVDVGRWP